MSSSQQTSEERSNSLPFWRQIRWNLVLYFVLLAVLPLVIVITITLARTSVQARQQVTSQLESVADLKYSQIDAWLNTGGEALDLVLASPVQYDRFVRLAAAPEENAGLVEPVNSVLVEAMLALQDEHGHALFEELFVYTADGRIVAASRRSETGKVVTLQPYFEASLRDEYIQPPYYAIGSPNLTLIVTRPLRDANRQVVGVLAGRLAIFTLGEVMAARSGLGETGETYLVSAENNYLVTPTRFGKDVYPLVRAYHSEGIDRALAGENGYGLYNNYEHPPVPVIGVYRWIPELQVALLAEQSQAEALAAATQARNFSIGMATLAALIAAGVGYLTVTQITRPITRMTRTATRIAEGDLSQRVEVTQQNEVGVLGSAFNTMADRLQDLVTSLEDRVAARTRDLQVAAEVSLRVSALLDLNELLPALVELTKSSFNLYHAHVYLLDDAGERLIMEAGAGEAGRQMKAAGHSIPLSAEPSLVALAGRTRRPIIIPDVTVEPDFLPNPLLPETRSEMAVPMVLGDRLIGVLDVQSEQPGHFTDDSIPVMFTLAGQVAVAVNNARAYSELRRAQEETKQALDQLARRNRFVAGIAQFATMLLNLGITGLGRAIGALAEAANASRVYVFENFTDSKGRLACRQIHEWVAEGIRSEPNPHVPYDEAIPHWKDDLLAGRPVMARRSETVAPEIAILEEQNIYSLLLLPIMVGGQPWGFIGFDDCVSEREWQQAEVEMLQTASTSISYTIMGARLLQQTQEALEQVETLYEMSQAFIAARTPQELLEAFVRLNPAAGSCNAYLVSIQTGAEGQSEWVGTVASVVGLEELDRKYAAIRDNPKDMPLAAMLVANPHQAIAIPDFRLLDMPEAQKQMLEAAGVGGVVAIPLTPAGGRVLGAIILIWDQPHEISDTEQQLYNVVAPQMATILENMRLVEETQRSERLLRTVIDTSPDWIWVKDRDFRYMLVSRGVAEDGLGTTPDQMIGRDDYAFYPPEIVDGDPERGIRGFRADDRVALSGQRVHNPHDVVRYSDGSEHVLDTTKVPLTDGSGNIIGTLGIGRDITEQERARQRERLAYEMGQQLSSVLSPAELLQTTIARLHEAFNYYHAHIYLLDESGERLVVREGLGEAGRQMKAAGHSIPLNAPRSLVARAARALEPVVVNDVIRNPDHLPNPLLPETRSEVAVPLVVGERLLGVLDVQQNYPNHFTAAEVQTLSIVASQLAVALSNAELYEEQARTAEQLRELDRLKSEFLANMSHELRTPLNSIIGYSELLIDDIGPQLDEMSLEDLRAIHSSGHHLLSIINDILDLAKIEAGRMELTPSVVHVPDFVVQIVDMSRVLLKDKPGVQLLVDVPDDVPELHADPVRLRQILWNLLSNAIKFTDEGYVRLSCRVEDGWMYMSVQDTGVGIPPDKHEVVFDQFRQADGSATRRAGGTGLGLAITRQLVQLHGGELWLEKSVVGEGSTFTFKLPLRVSVRAAEAPADGDGRRQKQADAETPESVSRATGD